MNRNNLRPLSKFFIYLALTVLLVIWVFPIAIALSKSFDVNGLGNYLSILNHPKISYFRVICNSLLISTSTSIIVVFLTTFASFAFSKMKFKGRNVIYMLLLSCLAVPIASVTSPMFFSVKNLGLMNTYWALILPLVAFNAPLMLTMVRSYFDTIPNELIEAAIIDGCKSFGIYRRVMLPLSVPIVANISVLTFVYSWNDYLIPLLFTQDEAKYTVTIAATYFMDTRSQTPEMVAQLYAALILMTIPSVIVYLFSQKYLQSGITAGAVKS